MRTKNAENPNSSNHSGFDGRHRFSRHGSRSTASDVSLRSLADMPRPASVPSVRAERNAGDSIGTARDPDRMLRRPVVWLKRKARNAKDWFDDLYCIIKQQGYWALIGLAILGLLGWEGAQYAGCLVMANPWLCWLPWVIIALPLWGVVAGIALKEYRKDWA